MKHWENRIGNMSYTNRDAQNIREDLVDYVKENYGEQLTDFNESSIIMMLIEMLAGSGDMLSYRIDRQALESYLPTAKQRSNIKAILSSLGYRFEMATAAVGTCQAYIPSNSYVPSGGITLYKGTQLNANDSQGNRYPLIVTEDTLVPYPGEQKVDVPLAQGSWTEMSVKVSDIVETSRFYLSLGTKNTSVARKYVQLKINGEWWENIDDVLADSTEVNKTFSVYEDKLDRPYILFHRNFRKLLKDIPNATVDIAFLETYGDIANVGSLTISAVNSFVQIYKNDISAIRFSELTVLSGGSSRETTDHAKQYAPKVFKTLDRAVTLEDYEAFVGAMNGVSKVKALDWKSKYITTPYVVLLLVAPTGGTALSDSQAYIIRKYLEPKMLSTINLQIRSANYVKIDVEAVVHLSYPVDENVVRQKIINDLQEAYNLETCEFGKLINASNIVTTIQQAHESISYIDLVKPEIDGTVKADELSLYILGDITITVKGGE